MSQSIASHYATRMERTAVETALWAWPRKQHAAEPQPDPRLLSGEVARHTAQIRCANGDAIQAQVRSVTQHDVVLTVQEGSSRLVMGQVVEVSVFRDDRKIVHDQKSILHWSGSIHGEEVVSLFTVDQMGPAIERLICDKPRGEIRFPVDLSVVVKLENGERVNGQIMDYSLNGCRLVCHEQIPLDREYSATVFFSHSSVDVKVQALWVLNTDIGCQMGCTFPPEQGVLLACRHHPQPTGLSCPLKPQTSNWDGVPDSESAW